MWYQTACAGCGIPLASREPPSDSIEAVCIYCIPGDIPFTVDKIKTKEN